MKEFLSRHGVDFAERLLTVEANRREVEHRGSRAAPLTLIGGRELAGFEPVELHAALACAGLVGAAPQPVKLREAALRTSLAVAPAHSIVVANFLDDSLTFLDTRSGRYLDRTLERSSLSQGGHPIAVEASRPGGSLAVVSYESGSVSFLSAADGSPLHGDSAASTLETGELPLHAVAHPERPLLYVSNSESNSVTAFDAATGEYASGSRAGSSFPVPGQPGVMAIDAAREVLYVRLREGAVARLRVDDLVPIGAKPREASVFPTGRGRGIALSPDGTRLFAPVALGEAEGLGIFDPKTGESVTRAASVLPTAPVPFAIAAHPIRPIVYVSCFGTQLIEFRDAGSGDYLFGSSERSSVAVGRGARAMFVDSREEVLYVSCFDEGEIVMLDALSGHYRYGSRAASTRRTGAGPRGMAYLSSKDSS